ncbi:MAG: YjbQ family protein [Desulfobacter sp.]|nr:YjbQ family protein [Desulfobacter sp.]
MHDLKMSTHTITCDMETGVDICDITDELNALVSGAGIVTGMAHVFVPGSTGAATTIEYEPGVVNDLKRAINELAAPGRLYDHELAWHDGNDHSHVQAALLGPSISIPIREARLALGDWQQTVVINHDNSPRTREISITLIGC